MGHVCRGVLRHVLGGKDTWGLDQAEIAGHIAGCARCLHLALSVVAELEAQGDKEPRQRLFTLLADQEERSLADLAAEGRLAKLKRLTQAKRLELIQTTAVYRTRAMVKVLLRETMELARSRSEDAEEFGKLTLALIELLSSDSCPAPVKRDLRASVWTEVGNGRRTRTDWNGASQALKQAGALLRSGTGNPLLLARLHSIRSSLFYDTGLISFAAQEAVLAQGIYRELEEWSGLANTLLKESDALVEVDPERGLRLADEGLKFAEDFDTRLRLHLNWAAVQCLIELGRTAEALKLFEESRCFFDQLCEEPLLNLRRRAIQARLLEIRGRFQEAELLYREVIEDTLEGGFAKESFTFRLMLFSFYVQRNRMEDASALCAQSAKALEEAGAHKQMREVWHDLSAYVQARRVDEKLMKALRLYLAHHWGVPAKKLPFTEGWAEQAVAVPVIEVAAAPELQPKPTLRPAPPVVPQLLPEPLELVESGLRESVEGFERRLIASALEQSGGRIRETARVLRTSRNTLKSKMKRYGLRGEE